MKRHAKQTQLELLPFRVGAREYAIDVLQVREVRPSAHISPIIAENPRIRGAIDVRGVLVPVVDLREDASPLAPVGDAMVIVVAVARRLVAILVDAVREIVELAPPFLTPLVIVYDVSELIATRMTKTPLATVGDSACR